MKTKTYPFTIAGVNKYLKENPNKSNLHTNTYFQEMDCDRVINESILNTSEEEKRNFLKDRNIK